MDDLQPPNDQACPLCGADNGCAMVTDSQGAEQCWCMQVTVSPQALARVPDELKNKACLCQACAAASSRPDTSEQKL